MFDGELLCNMHMEQLTKAKGNARAAPGSRSANESRKKTIVNARNEAGVRMNSA